MDRSEIEKRYTGICTLIFDRKFKASLDELGQVIRLVKQSDYHYRLESLAENYKTLLRYAFEGYKDPRQDSILNTLATSMLELADEVKYSLADQYFPERKQEKLSLCREFGTEPVFMTTAISEIFFNREFNRLMEENDLQQSEPPAASGIPLKQMDSIFRLIWLTDKVGDDLFNLIQRFTRPEAGDWPEKCLIASAITLSLLNHFDVQKFLLLIDLIETGQTQVYQRALTGLILCLLVYDQRLIFYPGLNERLKQVSDEENIARDVEIILLQLLMARETEKITREFEEEVLPEMKKMMPKIEDKLHLSEPWEEEDMEDKNPGWKDMIEEVPGLFEKIEKFSRMQMEGGDVFMSTFRLLKRFDFFNIMSNWFVPFHPDHAEIRNAYSEKEEINQRLITSLDNAFYICNSDKYSFALNFLAIPAQQRSLIVTNFEAEFAQMQEMATEEQLLDQSLKSNSIFIQYIQDLYRFYKLHPLKAEFEDIFQFKIHFNDLWFYKTLFDKEGFTERLASFYFEKEHYYEAISIYEYLTARTSPKGEHYEKIAYCYQKTGHYRKAVDFYKKAELFDTDRFWILKKLGWCSLKLKDYHAALEYFKDASSLQPDDLHIQSQVGQCYLYLKDFEQALQYYARVGFYTPDNLKVLRPIAYSQFVLGKLSQAEEAYRDILAVANPPSPYDLMNSGHVQLCLKKRKEAASFYRQCLAFGILKTEDVIAAYEEDVTYLIKNGIAPEEIPLIRDFLLFLAEKE